MVEAALNEKVEVKRNRKVIGIGAQIIKAFGLSTIKFIGTKRKYPGLSGFNIEIEEFVDE